MRMKAVLQANRIRKPIPNQAKLQAPKGNHSAKRERTAEHSPAQFPLLGLLKMRICTKSNTEGRTTRELFPELVDEIVKQLG